MRLTVPRPGPTGLGNVGNPWWTFQPELILSYLGNGWNLSAAIYDEINTANSKDNYTTGDIFHVDFTATKTIGKWTFGPVGYYVAQVTDDKCPVGTCTLFNPLGTLTNASRYQLLALGGLVEYNFGPASLSVWATQEVYSKATNNAASASVFTGGNDFSLITRGMTVFATLSYRLWAPEEPTKPVLIHK
ncbi:MAG: transporter [Bradyrhizobium sp.]